LSKKTFEAAAAAQAHLIVQLKDNQPTLCRSVEVVCKKSKPLSAVQTIDRNKRNRHETRTVAVFDARRTVAETEWQPHVAAIVAVERKVLTFQPATGLWKSSSESSFYLSNRPVRADTAAAAIREHWGIENKLHYTRDVTLREDASRIRRNAGIFARIRSFAYNILRFNQSDTIAQDRYAAALGGLDALCALNIYKER
jgi:predicted transposase YbfD/YdcC